MTLASCYEDIRNNIDKIIKNSPLSSKEVTVLAASKGQGPERIEEAIKAGINCFGENRVQEAAAKWPEIKKRYPQVRLHMIGPLQTNKAAQALDLFDVIQTVDRPQLAEELARIMARRGKATACYIQVNTGSEPQKAGILPEEADHFIRDCVERLRLPVEGLMCIPPVSQLPAPHFALLRNMAERHGLTGLSMGMSEDFEVAVRMGASCVRLGRILFGERS